MKKSKKLKTVEVEIVPKRINKPRVNWDALPDWTNWVSMDENGRWRCFIDKPHLLSNFDMWGVSGDNTGNCSIPVSFCPKWGGEWKDSLTERPRTKRK